MRTKTSRRSTARPFPWPCPNCLTATIVPTVIPYTASVKHDGVIYPLSFPALEVPRCRRCGETVITNAVDEQIHHALRLHLRLLTPAQMRKGIKDLGLNQQEV